MIKVLVAASLLLTGSSALADETRWPSYCIRSVEQNAAGYLLDIPGWPYGMDNKPIQVLSLDRLDKTNECSPNDPRMIDD